MKKIRLKDEYYWCGNDEYIEISDDVFAVMLESRRIDEREMNKRSYHKAHYSLDAGDDIQELSESLGGDEYGEEVERARQIIGEQGDIVSTAAALPCPEQRAAVLQFVGLGLIYNLDKKTLAKMNEDLGRKDEVAVSEEQA